MPRRAGNWLQAYREYTDDTESPESYHLFCGLSALASVAQRNVWIDQGIYPVYPNLFAILVGPPGRCGKSTAIRLGRILLYAVPGVTMGPDSTTREDLIKLLANSYTNGQAAMTIHSTELSGLIDPSGIKMVQLLTELYDCDYKNPKGWQYSTKHTGKDTIKNPFLNLLAATTPSYVAEGLPEAVTEHGFTSRCVFIYEEAERKMVPFPSEPPAELVVRLSEDLVHVSQLKGQFRWTDEAREVYREFYANLQHTIPEDDRIKGFHWRKRTHVLKLAILYSLADKDDLVLQPNDIRAAIETLRLIEPKMARTFTAVGKFEHAMDIERFHAQILAGGREGIEYSQIVEKNYHVGDLQTIDSLIAALLAMNRIRREKTETGWKLYATGYQGLWESRK